MRGFFINFVELLIWFPIVVIVWNLVTLLSAWRIKKTLLRNRLTTFGHYGRYLILGGTVAANLIIFVAILVAADILAYGVLHTSFLPSAIYTPIVTTYIRQQGATGDLFLQGIYSSFKYIFWDYFPLRSRIFGVVLTGMLLWPFFSITLNTIKSIVWRPIRAWLTVVRSADLSEYDAHPAVPDGLEVRVIERDDIVDIRPLPLLFGRRNYVLLTAPVVEELRDEPLTAIIRHEEYHLLHREYSFVATLLSLAIGGRNALLAFYDYPQIETDADAYAADKVGKGPLITAIRQLPGSETEPPSTVSQLDMTHPGFVGPLRESTLADRSSSLLNAVLSVDIETVMQSLRAWYRTIDAIASSFDDLLFGATLYNAAHLTKEERIQRIADLEL